MKEIKTYNLVFYFYILSKVEVDSLLIKYIDEVFMYHKEL